MTNATYYTLERLVQTANGSAWRRVWPNPHRSIPIMRLRSLRDQLEYVCSEPARIVMDTMPNQRPSQRNAPVPYVLDIRVSS